MIRITDKSQCTGCTACYNICSRKAIRMQSDEFGQIYPQITLDLCSDCNLCETVCPLLHQDIIPKDDDTDSLEVKAIFNKDSDVRRRSTSGGVFSLLADYIIKKGGVVCAARFDERFHIHHAFFESIDEIDPFRGSKYAQSDLSDVFKQIKKYLKTKIVMFVGTPCQVAGLKCYLIKDYENLYTCDFICMSISSGKMWDEYILDYQKNHLIKRIFFKDKRIGWHKSDWRMLIEDEQGEHLIKGFENLYLYTYLNHYSARISCFSCAFRHCKHLSDFTIADCWGIDEVHPEFDDNKGCTSLILQTEKGRRVFDTIKKDANYIDYDIDSVRQYNRHIEHQASVPKDYDKFILDYYHYGFMFAAKRVVNKSRNHYFVNIIKKVVKSIRK